MFKWSRARREPTTPKLSLAFLSDLEDGTELFSLHRQPFPRCYPGTCEDLIKAIELGSESDLPCSATDLDANIRWITGPAGSGKSALAQTIGERGCAAAFFFSRSLDRTDPLRLWSNIASQLKLYRHPPTPRGVRLRTLSLISSTPSSPNGLVTAQVPGDNYPTLNSNRLELVSPQNSTDLSASAPGPSFMSYPIPVSQSHGFSPPASFPPSPSTPFLPSPSTPFPSAEISSPTTPFIPPLGSPVWSPLSSPSPAQSFIPLYPPLPSPPRTPSQLNRVLTDKMNLRGLFNKEFQDPLSRRTTSLPEGFIIIDGLDECEDEEHQSEIVHCICDSVRQHTGLRWMVFSRPEPHLKQAFEDAQSEGICWIKEIHVDRPDMQRDVKKYLEKEFQNIAKTYVTDVEIRKSWPSQEAIDKTIKAAGGLFIYAVTIIKFVRDPLSRNPTARLQMVVDAIDGVPISDHALNPISTIDTLYRGLIERTRPDLMPLTLELLGILIVCPPLPLFHFACLHEFDLPVIRDALLSLHSVIAVPSDRKTGQEPLHYFHASFADFLINPSRAKDLARNPTLHRTRTAESCFRVLNSDHMPGILLRIKAHGDHDTNVPFCITMDLLDFSSTYLWQMCTQIPNPGPDFMKWTVGCFQFTHLRSICEFLPADMFVRFLVWLHKYTTIVPELGKLVRTAPLSTRDEQLLKVCGDVSQPLDLGQEGAEVEDDPDLAHHALLGLGSETVIILVVSEAVMVYSIEDIEDV